MRSRTTLGLGLLAGIWLALLALAACTTEKPSQAAKRAEINKQAASEINRICALPEDQREAELKKIKEQSGIVLYCGSK